MEDPSSTILLVDDDADTRGSILRVLQKKGYRVLEADGPVEATEIAHRSGNEIDLVVLDVIMPGMSGKELADTLHQQRPDTKIFLMSGYTGEKLADDNGWPVMGKPLDLEQLDRELRAALEP